MLSGARGFNEAAGFTRRKRHVAGGTAMIDAACFNEAAGFTRRKLPRRPQCRLRSVPASMRPPDLPGGNPNVRRARRGPRCGCFNEAAGFTRRKPTAGRLVSVDGQCRFNEAAGFTRRKQRPKAGEQGGGRSASMRPPDLPGGNGPNGAGKTTVLELQ